MNFEEIQEMFSEIGLGTLEQRNKLVKELSINMLDSTYDLNIEIKISNNTQINELYA